MIRRHDEIRDVTASLLREVTQSVETEPVLQPLTGEVLRGRSANTEDDARTDVKCRGFWNAHQDVFLDVWVLTHLRRAIAVTPLSSSTSNMNEKKGECMSKECEK